MAKYTWRVAEEDDFAPIYRLIINSEHSVKWDMAEIKRRVSDPMALGQLLIVHLGDELRGFLTFAFMNEQSACHQASTGVTASDWRSGHHLWLVDLFCPFGDGAKIIGKIRGDVEEALPETIRYFRHKHKLIRRITP
jgi:hemolysin-activating ACP:hemolysin acyltransferase